MPRTSNNRYIVIHQQLRQWWLQDKRVFACLSAREQWQLHDFYALARELREHELLEHRVAITEAQRSPPQQAGRALAKFERTVQPFLAAQQQHQQGAHARPLTMYSVVNPEPDLGKVVVAMAEWLAREQRFGSRREDHGDAP